MLEDIRYKKDLEKRVKNIKEAFRKDAKGLKLPFHMEDHRFDPFLKEVEDYIEGHEWWGEDWSYKGLSYYEVSISKDISEEGIRHILRAMDKHKEGAKAMFFGGQYIELGRRGII